MSKPFIKWAGGKTYSLSQLRKYVPKDIKKYYEVMVGGGALFIALADAKQFKAAKISDTNHELICAYQAIRDIPGELCTRLKTLESAHNKSADPDEYYYDVRKFAIEGLSIAKKAARFIYLNKAGFNGLYRVNRDGRFNVPTGHKTKVKLYDAANITKLSKLLQNVEITEQDFEAAIDFEEVRKGDVAYFDPPYWPIEKTSFTEYTSVGFDSMDHERLADVAKRLKHKGVRVVLSNSDVPAVHALYEGMHIDRVAVPRRINSDGKGRGNVFELIIRSHK